MKYPALASILLLLLASDCHAQVLTITDFVGTWKITKLAGYANISDGPPGLKVLQGTTLIVSPKGIKLGIDKEACLFTSGFEVKEVEAAPYLKDNAGATPEGVKLPTRVTILDSDACPPIFWLNENLLEIDVGGVFVTAERQQ